MVIILILILVITFASGEYINISGCPSLYQYDFTKSGDDFPKCFCDNSTESSEILVQVNCLYFSTLQDLGNALRTVVKNNKKVTTIYLEHMFFNDEGLPDDYFVQHKVTPESITITKCGDGNGQKLILKNFAFRGLEKSLTKLTIRECALSDELPDSIKSIKSLKSLELYRTSIKTIKTKDLYELDNLEMLDLSNNHLQSIQEKTFENLQHLTTLKLAGNSLTLTALAEINKTLPKLVELDISSNNVTNLAPNFLSALKSLEITNLRNNNLFSLKNGTFAGLDNLKTLDLRVNILHDIDSHTFHSMPKLQELYLAGNYLQNLNVDQFAMPNLTSLELGYNNLGNLNAGIFRNLPNLIELDLRKNEELGKIADKALEGLTNLRYLNLSNTNLSVLNDDLFQFTPNLETLDLSNSQLNGLDKAAFNKIPRLSWLSFATTKLQTIPNGIFDNLSELYSLDISGNNWICDDKLSWLSKWIVENFRNNSIIFTAINDVKCVEPDEQRNVPLVKLYDPNFQLEPINVTITPSESNATDIAPNFSDNSTLSANPARLEENNDTVISPLLHNITNSDQKIPDFVTESNNHTNLDKQTTTANDNKINATTVNGKNEKQSATTDGGAFTISATASIIIAVVVVLAATITLAIVVIVILTMKRRRLKASRMAALKNFVVPTSSPNIEMCQRPESNRISDIDIVKENQLNSFTTTNRNHLNGLYNDNTVQQQNFEKNDLSETQSRNGNSEKYRKQPLERPALKPPPQPQQK